VLINTGVTQPHRAYIERLREGGRMSPIGMQLKRRSSDCSPAKQASLLFGSNKSLGGQPMRYTLKFLTAFPIARWLPSGEKATAVTVPGCWTLSRLKYVPF